MALYEPKRLAVAEEQMRSSETAEMLFLMTDHEWRKTDMNTVMNVKQRVS